MPFTRPMGIVPLSSSSPAAKPKKPKEKITAAVVTTTTTTTDADAAAGKPDPPATTAVPNDGKNKSSSTSSEYQLLEGQIAVAPDGYPPTTQRRRNVIDEMILCGFWHTFYAKDGNIHLTIQF